MVDVREYTRGDGTRVSAHTRSAPMVVAAGGGTGLLILLVILYAAATHNLTITVPAAPATAKATPAAVHAPARPAVEAVRR